MLIQWQVMVLADGGSCFYREVSRDELILPPAIGQEVQLASLDEITESEIGQIVRSLAGDGIIIRLLDLNYTYSPDNPHLPTNEAFVSHLQDHGWVPDRAK